MLHDLQSQIRYEHFCVTEQKYATIADGIAFHLRAKEGALQMLKLLILVTRTSEVQFGLQSYRWLRKSDDR